VLQQRLLDDSIVEVIKPEHLFQVNRAVVGQQQLVKRFVDTIALLRCDAMGLR